MKIKSKNVENHSPNQIHKIQTRQHKRNFGKDLKQLQPDNLLGKKTQCLKKSRNKKIEENPVSEYENDILNRILYLESHQQGFKVNHNYIKLHNLLNNKMRVFLVKYLYKLYMKLRLKRTTLYLAVFYMDNYFQKTKIYSESDLIIICQASMHIAMKYEEIYPPELSDWAGVKNKNAIYAAQSEILKQLDFKLAHFTVQHFRQYYLYKKNIEDPLKQEYTKLIADSLLFDANFYQFKASELAKNIINIVTTKKIKKTSSDDIFAIVQQPIFRIKQHIKIDIFEWVFKNFSLSAIANTLQQVVKQIDTSIQNILAKSTKEKVK